MMWLLAITFLDSSQTGFADKLPVQKNNLTHTYKDSDSRANNMYRFCKYTGSFY